MKFSKLPAEIANRLNLPAEVFDSLPEVAQRAMVNSVRQAMQEVQEYEERQKRALELLRESGIPERIGLRPGEVRTRLDRIEMGRTDLSCEFPQNEPKPVHHLGGRVMGLQHVWNRARAMTNVQRSAFGHSPKDHKDVKIVHVSTIG